MAAETTKRLALLGKQLLSGLPDFQGFPPKKPSAGAVTTRQSVLRHRGAGPAPLGEVLAPRAGCPEFLCQSAALALREEEEIGPERTDLLPGGLLRVERSGSWWRCGVEQLAAPRRPPGSSARVGAFPRMRTGAGFSPSCNLPLFLVGKQRVTARAVDPRLSRSRSCGGKERGAARPRAGGSSAGPSGARCVAEPGSTRRGEEPALPAYDFPVAQAKGQREQPESQSWKDSSRNKRTSYQLSCFLENPLGAHQREGFASRGAWRHAMERGAAPEARAGARSLCPARGQPRLEPCRCVGPNHRGAGGAKGRQASGVCCRHGGGWGGEGCEAHVVTLVPELGEHSRPAVEACPCVLLAGSSLTGAGLGLYAGRLPLSLWVCRSPRLSCSVCWRWARTTVDCPLNSRGMRSGFYTLETPLGFPLVAAVRAGFFSELSELPK